MRGHWKTSSSSSLTNCKWSLELRGRVTHNLFTLFDELFLFFSSLYFTDAGKCVNTSPPLSRHLCHLLMTSTSLGTDFSNYGIFKEEKSTVTLYCRYSSSFSSSSSSSSPSSQSSALVSSFFFLLKSAWINDSRHRVEDARGQAR